MNQAIAAISLGRADLVGKWFDSITEKSSVEDSSKLFERIREGILCIYPFLGAPACMPACYGMIGVVERKGEAYGNSTRRRKGYMTQDDVERGAELRGNIYKTAGNRFIFDKMEHFFPDLCQCSMPLPSLYVLLTGKLDAASTAFTWGYLIARANDEVFTMQESHLLVLTAICGLGAKRQMGSHIKATIGIGNGPQVVKRLLSTLQKLSEWAGRSLSMPDVDALADQVADTAKR